MDEGRGGARAVMGGSLQGAASLVTPTIPSSLPILVKRVIEWWKKRNKARGITKTMRR